MPLIFSSTMRSSSSPSSVPAPASVRSSLYLALGTAAVLGAISLYAKKIKQALRRPRYTQLRIDGNDNEKLVRQYKSASAMAQDLVGAGNRYFVYVGAATDATGQAWCSDCRRAESVVHSALDCVAKNNSDRPTVVISADLDKQLYRRADHPFRVDPTLQLSAVPTLFCIADGKVVSKLVESECEDSIKVAQYIGQAIIGL